MRFESGVIPDGVQAHADQVPVFESVLRIHVSWIDMMHSVRGCPPAVPVLDNILVSVEA